MIHLHFIVKTAQNKSGNSGMASSLSDFYGFIFTLFNDQDYLP